LYLLHYLAGQFVELVALREAQHLNETLHRHSGRFKIVSAR